MLSHFTSPLIRPPFACYSHGVSVDAGARILFCSGQLGVGPDDIVPEDAPAQAALCFDNIHAVLDEAGMSASDERLYEIIRVYEDHGCPVSDPHTFIIEDGGMKHADYRHLAWKKRLDPLGLLNPGKSREWSRVRHMDPQAIEALQPRTAPGTA